MNTNEKESWEIEFDKFQHYRDPEYNVVHFACTELEHTEHWDNLKSFVKQLLSNQRSEIGEQIEKELYETKLEFIKLLMYKPDTHTFKQVKSGVERILSEQKIKILALLNSKDNV